MACIVYILYFAFLKILEKKYLFLNIKMFYNKYNIGKFLAWMNF